MGTRPPCDTRGNGEMANTTFGIMNDEDMRDRLTKAAVADAPAFVDRVMKQFDRLKGQIVELSEQVDTLQHEKSNQAALIAQLSLQKEQAQREAAEIVQRSRQEAAEIISDAKAQARTLTEQAETRLMQANMEADSIIETKLSGIRHDIADLETQRSVEKTASVDFFRRVADEYDAMIQQQSETLAQTRDARSFLSQRMAEIQAMKLEHFDVTAYMPHRADEKASAIAFGKASQTDDAGGIMAGTTRSFNDAFHIDDDDSLGGYGDTDDFEGILGDDTEYEDADDFGDDDFDDLAPGDSGLLREAMGDMTQPANYDQMYDQGYDQGLMPSDSGLLREAMSSLDDDDLDDIDDIEDFGDEFMADSSARRSSHIDIPVRRGSNKAPSRGWL